MPRNPDQIHQRFLQQASWTRAIRQRAFSRFRLAGMQRIVEVGSGTGAIASELHRASPGSVVALDCDPAANAFARDFCQGVICVTGLAEQLPFPPDSFDLSCCHFLLLWVANPLGVLLEMKRVTRPGGGVLCLAEPDYGARIDYPEGLAELGALQEEALRAQGACTRMGRRLRALLHQAGLKDVQAGVLGGEWADADAALDGPTDLEWQTLADDLSGRVPAGKMHSLAAEFTRAQADRSRVLFVPTFYGWGTRPGQVH
jgi:SAM-dependent methyltransferase